MKIIRSGKACIEIVTMKLSDRLHIKPEHWNLSKRTKNRKWKIMEILRDLTAPKRKYSSETRTKFILSWREWWFRHFILFFFVLYLLPFPYFTFILYTAFRSWLKKNEKKRERKGRKVSALDVFTRLSLQWNGNYSHFECIMTFKGSVVRLTCTATNGRQTNSIYFDQIYCLSHMNAILLGLY